MSDNLFCGIGVCFNCVAGDPAERTCLPPVSSSVPSPSQAARRRDAPAADPDVLVVGAGPAGLAAAVAAAEAGAAVTVVDLNPRPGGQYLRQPLTPKPVIRASRKSFLLPGERPDHGVVERAVAHPRVSFLTGTEVWQVGPDRQVRAGKHTLRPRAVVLAPGAYDRVVPFPGWDLPGVVTAGGAQALAKSRGVPIGRRVLVAGTGPFLLAVAGSLAEVGAEVVAVVEASRLTRWLRHPGAIAGSPGRLLEAARYLSRGIPLWQGSAVTAVSRHGANLVATVEGHGTVEVDAVCVGHGFTPSVELAVAFGCATRVDPRDGSLVVTVDGGQRSTVPGVLVAGEATGVGGAALAMAEGAVAGLAAAHHIGLIDDSVLTRAATPYRRKRAARKRFADALHAVYPPPAARLADGTLLCRCERVTAGRARAEIHRYGIDDARALKLLTRVGMGRCQGRMCGRAALDLLAEETGRAQDPAAFASRPIAMPVPLGTVAEEGTTA